MDNKKIILLLTSIISVMIGISLIAGLTNNSIPEIFKSLNKSTEFGRCADEGCYYNYSNTPVCQAAENNTAACSEITSAPLGGLFIDKGMITTVLVGMIFLALILLVFGLISKN